MVTVHVDDGSATITVALPGTFDPLAEGPRARITGESRDARRERQRGKQPAPGEIEIMVDHVCATDGWLDGDNPIANPGRSLLRAILKNAPRLRKQVGKAIVQLYAASSGGSHAQEAGDRD